MANYKRKKCRRSIRCSLCTPVRWLGNSKGRVKHRDRRNQFRGSEEDSR